MIVYVILNTMCPPGYHHNGFVATHAPRALAQVYELPQSHCGAGGHIVFMITHILRSSCFCEI